MNERQQIREFIDHRMPDPGVRRIIFRLLADVIEAVNSQDEDVWSLTFRNGNQFRLNIGGIEAFNTSHNQPDAWFMLLARRSLAEAFINEHALPADGYLLEGFAAPLPQEEGIVRFFLPAERFTEHHDALAEMWREAALVLATKYRRTNKARQHSRESVELIGEEIGRDLPQPDYGPSNPVQTIYNALSPEAKVAVDALPNEIFNDDEGASHAKWFARSITKAHEGSAECWAIVTFDENELAFVALNISGRNVISLSDKLRFVVQRDLVNEDALGGKLDDYISWDKYKTRKYLVQVQVDTGTSSGALAELERVHLLTVQRVAKGKVGLQGRNHRDDIRVKLALLNGENVPAPAYVPETTHGFPYGLRLITRHASTGIDSQSSSADHMLRVSDEEMLAVVEALPDGFTAVGLTYSESQIASFYTALQTKGFVILSGISGTGKSKIAQRFADMLPPPAPRVERVLADGFVRVAVRPYMAKYKRIRLLNEVSQGLPVPAQGTSELVPFSVDGETGNCRVWTRPEANADVYLFPQGSIGDKFKSVLDDSFALRFHVTDAGDRLELIEMRTEIPTRQGAERIEPAPNHLFLPVRPDWRDGKALIGYHNPLSGEYVRTEFLDFVLAASDDYRAGNRNAFFVILDEMNLAHVEYYFADVLSVIESGRDEDGWTVEGIPLAVGDEDTDLPETLRLPPNLYIVGTVNMDETTHPFSPKVLDRAFAIELTEVSFEDYPPEQAGAGDRTDEEKHAQLAAFTRQGRYPRIDKDEIRDVVDDHPRFRYDLQALNVSLKRHRIHFGYRVFDEIMQFVHHAGENGLFAADEAFDHAVLMKVLPKFNGSRGKLNQALFELIHWCRASQVLDSEARSAYESRFAKLQNDGQSFDSIVVSDANTVEDNWRYPATDRRAALMMQDLYTDGFASFG